MASPFCCPPLVAGQHLVVLPSRGLHARPAYCRPPPASGACTTCLLPPITSATTQIEEPVLVRPRHRIPGIHLRWCFESRKLPIPAGWDLPAVTRSQAVCLPEISVEITLWWRLRVPTVSRPGNRATVGCQIIYVLMVSH